MTVVVLTFVMTIAIAPTDAGDNDQNSAIIGDTGYSNISIAIEAASPGETIVALDGATISSNLTIPTGVTLLVPYSSGTSGFDLDGTEDNYHTYKDNVKDEKDSSKNVTVVSSKKAGSNFCKNTLTIESDATLTVKGKLIVGGILSEAFTFDYQGHTSADHAVIKLSGNIQLDSGSELRCYGYIRGSGTVHASSGSTIYQPFIVTDYIGGDNAANQFNASQSPFNRYTFSNIESKVTMDYGSKMIGLANLYADNKFNKMELSLISYSDQKGLILLKNGSYITLEYNASKYVEDVWESNIYRDVGKTTVTISGGASFGGMVLSYGSRTANTSDVYFSIPYNFDYILSNGTYEVPNKLRILPGSTVTITSNSSLIVSGGVYVFDGLYDKEFRDKYYPRPDTLSSKGFQTHGSLYINGKLTITSTGRVLGVIESQQEGATVTVESNKNGSDYMKNINVPFGTNGRANGISKSSENLTSRGMSLWMYSKDGTRTILDQGKTYTFASGTNTESKFTYVLGTDTKNVSTNQTYFGVIKPTPESITLSRTNVTITEGDQSRIYATVQPSDIPVTITWRSEDTSIADVKDGLITAKKAGSTTIVVSLSGYSLSTSCSVTVNGATPVTPPTPVDPNPPTPVDPDPPITPDDPNTIVEVKPTVTDDEGNKIDEVITTKTEVEGSTTVSVETTKTFTDGTVEQKDSVTKSTTSGSSKIETVSETVTLRDAEGNTVSETKVVIQTTESAPTETDAGRISIIAGTDDDSVSISADVSKDSEKTAIDTVVTTVTDDGESTISKETLDAALDLQDRVSGMISDYNGNVSTEKSIHIISISADTQVRLSSDSLKQISDSDSKLTLTTTKGGLTFDRNVLSNLADATEQVSLSFSPADIESMNDAQKASVNDGTVINLSAMSGGQYIGDKLGAPVEVHAFHKSVEGLTPVAYYLDDSGNKQRMSNQWFEDDVMYFTTDHFSFYLIVNEEESQSSNDDLMLYAGIGLIVIIGICVTSFFVLRSR